MPIYRAQLAVHLDSELPRDAIVITPHFDDHGVGSDPEGLAQDLATGYASVLTGSKHVSCKMYVATGDPPHYPVGEAEANPTAAANSSCPREVAVCLSFYSQRNVPRSRGRVYAPACAFGFSTIGVRPSGPVMTTVSGLATLFADLGGPDVDWVVWSRTDKEARPVTHWYVDDEWDTVRSRGLRPTTRLTGSTSEAQLELVAIHSARLIHGTGQSRRELYRVPEGKRVAVRHVTLYARGGTQDHTVDLWVHGIPIVHWSPSRPYDTFDREARFVLYAGETMWIDVFSPAASYSVTGFVFDDAGGGRPDDADNEITPHAPVTLPADEIAP